MAKKNKRPEKDTSERWLLTYSDLMNLLLILFIIFFSMSQINQAKAEKVAESVRQGFGATQVSDAGGNGYAAAMTISSSATPGSGGDLSGTGQDEAAYQQFYNDVLTLIEQDGLESSVEVTLDDKGVIISFRDTVLFPSGSADLNDKIINLLDTIGDLLKTLNYSFILVEGHTDSDPIHTAQYRDNVALSFSRAGNVWRELVSRGLNPSSMASVGYGETRPIAPNDTPINKAKNRRVVITIFRAESDVNSHIASGAPTSAASAASPAT